LATQHAVQANFDRITQRSDGFLSFHVKLKQQVLLRSVLADTQKTEEI
jgi:hypothetical protein